ncbi:Peroxisomal membrane signal receptor PTS1 [Elasticomyces elasticus]|uniref:Peroxisomal targeting signal receptor n=1 Tax=Elasticomyces elasticus TaxID=574655 RepID=A0AAN7VMM6_9PEZI|nr:Peroxisomal membrane signal receptor PTS1 [Elasticomyces elasticus]
MSFLGGPECSTGANPLAQFQKQSAADTSLQRDRLTQRPPQLNGFRNQQLPDDAQFQEFQQQGPGFNEQLPQDANYQQQLFLLEQQQQQQARAGGGDGWAGEFAQQPPTFSPEQFAQQQGRNGAFSPQDFSNFRQQQMSPASRQAQTPVPQQQSLYQRPPMYGSTFGGSGFGMQRPMMFQPQQPMYGQQPQEQYQGKGKGRIQELSDTDWEEQFKELSTVDKEGELDQLDADAEQAIEAELNQMDRYATPLPFDLASCDPALTLHCGVRGQHGNKMVRDAGFGEFEDIWQGYQAEANVARDMLGDEGHMGEYDEWKDFDGMSHDFDGLRTFENRGPESSNYLFEENNLFDDVPNAFEEGLKIMREGGSLSLAALAFEAAVQKQPEMVEAWVALGSAQAQNEKESPAIRAMEQALKLDSNNLDALMGLSVSYTNEGYDSLAYRTLERWVSVKYPQLGLTPQGLDAAAQAEEEMGFTDRHQLHEKVTALFLEAAQLNPEGMDVDIDVQVGLGVLFYGSEDYDKAVDCFNAALDSAETGTMKREGEEHLLWNRLGATLANSGRSEEAIEAYSRALELRPNFVRARYNLGVSCINLGVLEQAAGHLLGALSMHQVIEREGRMKAAELLRDGNGNAVDDREVEGLLQQNQSTNLYDTLRRVFTQMDRRDLAEGEESESVSQPQVYSKVLRGDVVSDTEATRARWAIPNEAGGFDFADSVSLPQKPLGRLSVDILSGGGGSVVGIEKAQLKVGYKAGEFIELSPSHWPFKEASSDTRPWGRNDRGEMTYWTDAPVVPGEELPAAVTTDQETVEDNSLVELRAMVQRSREQRHRPLESQAGAVQENDRNLQQVKDETMRRDHEQLMAEYAGLNAQAVTVPTLEVSHTSFATFSKYEARELQERNSQQNIDFKETLREYAMKNIADMKGIGETSSKVWKQVAQLGAVSYKPVLGLIDRGEATWWLEEEHRALMKRHSHFEEDYEATLEELSELVGGIKMIVDPHSLRNHEEQFQELRGELERLGESIVDNMIAMRNTVDRFLADLKLENVHSPTRNTMEFAKYGANYYELDVFTTMFGGMFACALEDLAAHPANISSYWQERVDACREAMMARSHSGLCDVTTDIAEFKQNVQLVRDLQNEFGSPQHPNLIIDGRIGRALVDNALAFKGDAEARARTAVNYVDLPGSLRDYGYHMTMENQASQDLAAAEAARKNGWAAERETDEQTEKPEVRLSGESMTVDVSSEWGVGNLRHATKSLQVSKTTSGLWTLEVPEGTLPLAVEESEWSIRVLQRPKTSIWPPSQSPIFMIWRSLRWRRRGLRTNRSNEATRVLSERFNALAPSYHGVSRAYHKAVHDMHRVADAIKEDLSSPSGILWFGEQDFLAEASRVKRLGIKMMNLAHEIRLNTQQWPELITALPCGNDVYDSIRDFGFTWRALLDMMHGDIEYIEQMGAQIGEGIDALANDGLISLDVPGRYLEIMDRFSQLTREVRATASLSPSKYIGETETDITHMNPRLEKQCREMQRELFSFLAEVRDEMYSRGTWEGLVPSWKRGKQYSGTDRAGKSKL